MYKVFQFRDINLAWTQCRIAELQHVSTGQEIFLIISV